MNMGKQDLRLLHHHLKLWATESFGDDRGYVDGHWSRRNLASMMSDIEDRIAADITSPNEKGPTA